MRDMRNYYKILAEHLKGREHSGDLGKYERIILNCIL
jgi:hypothetical protein